MDFRLNKYLFSILKYSEYGHCTNVHKEVEGDRWPTVPELNIMSESLYIFIVVQSVKGWGGNTITSQHMFTADNYCVCLLIIKVYALV